MLCIEVKAESVPGEDQLERYLEWLAGAGRDYEAKWGIYFYFWIGDGEEGHIRAFCWFKEPALAMKKLASLGVGGVQIGDRNALISEPVGEATGGFTGAIHRALDIWIEVWRKAGGLQQFLPTRKIPEGQS